MDSPAEAASANLSVDVYIYLMSFALVVPKVPVLESAMCVCVCVCSCFESLMLDRYSRRSTRSESTMFAVNIVCAHGHIGG